jgi:hypothetical protein
VILRDHPARAGSVLRNERRAEHFAQPGREQTHHEIAAPARRIGDHDAHRFFGPALCVGGQRRRAQDRGGE